MSMIASQLLIALAVAAPLPIAALLFWPATRGLAQRLAPFTALPALGLALGGSEGISLPLPWFLLGAELALDATGRVFLLFSSWLWLIAAWFAGGYLTADRRAHHFFLFFLLAQTGNFGLILAHDLVSFNVFFALMGLAAYGLVIHRRDETALRAGRVYLTLVLVGEVLIFAGLIGLIATAGGLTNISAAVDQGPPAGGFILCFLLGFGVKAGLLPVHGWLPLAHPAAPVPASAVLSGAMIKAGLLGWLRFLAPPESAPAGLPVTGSVLPDWGLICLLLGLAATFYGAVMGMTRQEPKTVLAWSSISQMGLITAALGLGLSSPELFPRALATIKLYALHHGLAKGALFLAVALVAIKIKGRSTATGRASDKAGRRKAGPRKAGRRSAISGYTLLLAAGVLLPALSLAGAPFTSGYLAKEQLLATGRAVLASPVATPDLLSPDLWELLLKLSGVVTALLLLRFLALLRQQWQQHHEPETRVGASARTSTTATGPTANTKPADDDANRGTGTTTRAAADRTPSQPPPWRLLLPWGLLVLSGLPVGWFLLAPLTPSVIELLPAGGLATSGSKIISALAPLLIALVLAQILSRRWPARLTQEVPEPATLRVITSLWRQAREKEKPVLYWRKFFLDDIYRRLSICWREPGRRLEEGLASWPVAGCSSLLLIFLLFYLLL